MESKSFFCFFSWLILFLVFSVFTRVSGEIASVPKEKRPLVKCPGSRVENLVDLATCPNKAIREISCLSIVVTK